MFCCLHTQNIGARNKFRNSHSLRAEIFLLEVPSIFKAFYVIFVEVFKGLHPLLSNPYSSSMCQEEWTSDFFLKKKSLDKELFILEHYIIDLCLNIGELMCKCNKYVYAQCEGEMCVSWVHVCVIGEVHLTPPPFVQLLMHRRHELGSCSQVELRGMCPFCVRELDHTGGEFCRMTAMLWWPKMRAVLLLEILSYIMCSTCLLLMESSARAGILRSLYCIMHIVCDQNFLSSLHDAVKWQGNVRRSTSLLIWYYFD